MNKVIVYILCILVMSGIVYGFSRDRTLYYYDGVNYLTDHIGEHLALDGALVSEEATVDNGGWTLDAGNVRYNKTNFGNENMSMTLSVLNDKFSYTLQGSNASFTGSIGFQIYDNSTGSHGFQIRIITNENSNQDLFFDTNNDGGNTWYQTTEGGGSTDCAANGEGDIPTFKNVNYSIVFTFNTSSSLSVYINNSWCRTYAGAYNGFKEIEFFEKGIGGGISVYLTDFYVANNVTRPSAAAAPPAGSPATPTIVAPSPVDNSNNNTNVTLNVTHSSTLNDVRYYLYFGTNLVLNETHLYVNNATRTGDEYKSFLTNITDGTYYWKWRVQNISNGGFSANTTPRTLIIDTVNPTISFGTNNTWTTDNLTRIDSWTNNLSINMSFADDYLYRTLINLTNSSNMGVYTIYNTTITGTTANYSRIIDLTNVKPQNLTLKLATSDSHTLSSIKDYEVKKGFFKDYLEYVTEEGITIKVETTESKTSIRDLTTNKLKDRYTFDWEFYTNKNKVTFRVTSSEPLEYLDTDYNAHFVTIKGKRGNWIDFNSLGIEKGQYDIKKINDYSYTITINGLNQKTFNFNSIGGLNVVEDDYRIQITGIANITAYDPIKETYINFTSTLKGKINHSSLESNTTQYNNLSAGEYRIVVNATGYSTINTTITILERYEQFVMNMYEANAIDNCSDFTQKILSLYGKDEETDTDVNTTLDVTITHAPFYNLSAQENISFQFRNAHNYSICTNTNQTIILDAIMEYGDGSIYTRKKYYLNDYVANSSIENHVYLYHLNNSKASEITFTVFDKTTGDKVEGVFIKILRYYPGENELKVVEIARTDEVGQSLGKMVLADVFYRFIIEKPAGTVRLNSETLRILSLVRSFGISFATDVLDTWDKIHGVSTSVTCTKGTQTCRMTWSDESNIVQDATLEVWRATGLGDTLLYRETTSAAAGTISYTITEDTTGNTYTAEGYIESNTGTSNYFAGMASLLYSSNPFFTDSNQRLASLFPLFLLVVVLVFAMIDFGTVGVVIGSLLGLIIGAIIGILQIDPFYFISFILMAIILIYKLSK